MKKILILILGVLLLVGCSKNESNNGNDANGPSLVQEEAKNVLVDVNGKPVTIETYQKYYAMQSYDFEKEYGESVWNLEENGKSMREIRQEQTIEYLVKISLIEDYLTQKNINVDASVIDTALRKYQDSIKNDDEINAYFKENNIDDDFLKRFLKDQYYISLFNQSIYEEVSQDDAVMHDLFDDQYIRYKTRHILVEKKEDLDEILAQLNDEENPADFSDMARLYSIHSTSAVTGGDLGYRLVGSMPKAYEDVALSIEPYTVSEPVETEFGFHLIFVDDRQMLSDMIESGMPEEEIESYKAEIIKKYATSETTKVYNTLRSEAVVKINEALLNEE
ncbi:MAG: peptidylprolyl isomerase [Clostridia bacterium]|nr:peptidylprolyl isomerase [Clostridia bacterium]